MDATPQIENDQDSTILPEAELRELYAAQRQQATMNEKDESTLAAEPISRKPITTIKFPQNNSTSNNTTATIQSQGESPQSKQAKKNISKFVKIVLLFAGVVCTIQGIGLLLSITRSLSHAKRSILPNTGIDTELITAVILGTFLIIVGIGLAFRFGWARIAGIILCLIFLVGSLQLREWLMYLFVVPIFYVLAIIFLSRDAVKNEFR